MRGTSKAFRGLLVMGLLVTAGLTAQNLAQSAESVRPASGDSIPYQIQELEGKVLYFPDYVEGGDWSAQLVLSNVGATAATAAVEVYGRDGQPVTDLFDSGSTLEIPSRGSRVLRSTGGGASRRGWIEVQSGTGSVGGMLTYRNSQSGVEVGVAPIQLSDQFALFVEETSEIGTGLAIFNPNRSEIQLRIRDEEGSDPVGRELSWAGDYHRAGTLPEWLESVDTRFLRDFRGLLLLRTPDGSDFAPLGLRFGKRKGSLSAVPVIHTEVADRPPNPFQPAEPQHSLYFPDYVAGEGWAVQLMLGNIDPAQDAQVNIRFHGTPFQWLFDLGTKMSFGVPSQGNRVLETRSPRGVVGRGWVSINSEPISISGLLTYRHAETGVEVGVAPAQLSDQFALFVEETSEIGTGLAIFNPNRSEIQLRIRDEEGSDPVGRELSWAGDYHRAGTLPEWFESVDTRFLGDFRGLLLLRTPDGSDFAPLGLRFGKRKGSLSAVPAIPVLDQGIGDLGDDKMYWMGPGGIWAANLDGTEERRLIAVPHDRRLTLAISLALELIGNKIYWTSDGTIRRANLDGTAMETLFRSGLVGEAPGLALDLAAGKMYWVKHDAREDGWIRRANLDGTDVETLIVLPVAHVYSLELDPGAGKMYWAEALGHRIRRANLDGSQMEDLFHDTFQLADPHGLALDLAAGKMYWTERGQPSRNRRARIRRANLDGTQVEDVILMGFNDELGRLALYTSGTSSSR